MPLAVKWFDRRSSSVRPRHWEMLWATVGASESPRFEKDRSKIFPLSEGMSA